MDFSYQKMLEKQQKQREERAKKIEAAKKAKTEKKAEAERIANEHRTKRKLELAEQEKQRKIENRQRLEASIRRSFFNANPDATDADFERIKQDLIDEHFKGQMKYQENAAAEWKRQMSDTVM